MSHATPTMERRSLLAGLAVSVAALPALGQTPPAPPVEIRARPARVKLAPALVEPADLWLLADDLAPPVLTLRHGAEFAATLANDTPSPFSLHWQGLLGPNAADGVGGLTGAPLPPGGRQPVRFTPPDPGTILIRPCLPGRSGELAGRGLGGLLVVAEQNPPRVDADLAVVVRDWLAEPSGALAPFGDARQAASGGRLGNRLAADSAEVPKVVPLPPGSRVRLRLANGANARIMRLRFEGAKVFVAAVDGQPTETFEPLRSSLPFAPGTRYDLLLDMPAEPGRTVSTVALIGDGVPLVALRTTDAAAVSADRPAIAAPPLNPRLPPEIKLQNAVRRDVVLAGGATRNGAGEVVFPKPGAPVWTVNGAPGRLDGPPLASAKRGQPMVFGIANQTGFPQPIHIHGHVARLLHPLDDGWEPYWVDTFQVPEGRTLHVALLAENPGRWLIGSSVLERLDTGLFGWYEVT